jgi:hypothetical protein
LAVEAVEAERISRPTKSEVKDGGGEARLSDGGGDEV